MFVGTVHSFALTRIVLPFAAVAGRPALANACLASERQVSAALTQAVAEFYAEHERRYVDSTVLRLRKMMDQVCTKLRSHLLRVDNHGRKINRKYI